MPADPFPQRHARPGVAGIGNQGFDVAPHHDELAGPVRRQPGVLCSRGRGRVRDTLVCSASDTSTISRAAGTRTLMRIRKVKRFTNSELEKSVVAAAPEHNRAARGFHVLSMVPKKSSILLLSRAPSGNG
jgi:hypothetical protein